MREPERDKGRLEHVLNAIECVENYTQDVSKEDLQQDKLRLHATTYNVQIIGEAIYKLTKEFKQEHGKTPWRVIEKMRHILVHDYFQINYDVLWSVIKEDIPMLKEQVQEYIEEIR